MDRTGNSLRGVWRVALLLAGLLLVAPVHAERIKDLANIAGVRSNQLVGYGIVVGLDGTGDQTSQAPFTTQSLINMLGNLGITIPPGTTLQLKNVAAVMVTLQLPAFAQPGQQIDVTVSSMANAKSLKGGTLLMTPLKGADGQIYAVAQGNLIVGGAGGSAGGTKVTVNHLSAGRIPGGATVERSVPTAVGGADSVQLELAQADFGTAQRVVEAINKSFGEQVAWPLDGRRIQVRAPESAAERVGFLGRLENIDVTPMAGAARVIVNSRTGSIVMNQSVTLQECAVAHGNITVTVNTDTQISQPNPLSQGQTAAVQNAQVDVKQDQASLMRFKPGVTLTEVVKALNAVGATPLDLVNILQAMKSAGALRAELEVI
ncbi:flagellar basal body P-ring protein FlgI [Uliginosibacterium aquaticum]|uniref:Flagellar P-ring protein n=1 Tax=Uliginosibacterium aquaticum TaxID=2731212 RepID=A0ABX2IGB9_9RHOO|nr:flagellar basal body P-ring protein FlgI [Uliginosibacterium aquaticum]NSL55532.1 flagellar basal body P-ring protein FlgI [Uliginosibacterium aquaticum]